jgi:alpha-beta hydrolase superfamily lysophospholipase
LTRISKRDWIATLNIEEVVKVPPEYKEHFFDAGDGLRLFFRQWHVEEAKGIVAIVHGFAEHSGRYKHVAEILSQAGWSVAAFDSRGHGQSGGRRAHIDQFSEYIDDLQSFIDEIARVGYAQSPILLGHSQGGLVAARFAQMYPDRISALALSSPFLALAVRVPWFKAFAGKAVSGIFPSLAMKTGLDPKDLSHDQEVVDKYAADPLVSEVATARWFTEITKAQEITLQQASLVKLPLLVMQAGEDRLASVGATKRFSESAGSDQKVFHLYDGYFHEILNEVGREKVFDDLCNWLENIAR